MKKSYLLTMLVCTLGMGLAACGGDDGGPDTQNECTLVSNVGCEDGQVCAESSTGFTICAAPVEVSGSVVGLSDDLPIPGARVVAIDANGAPISDVAVSDVNGNYTLNVFVSRLADGAPSGKITLRADASGFQTFPAGVRPAFPVDLAEAVLANGVYALDSTLTDLALISLPPEAPTGSISGTVSVPEDKNGVLVVAVNGEGKCPAKYFLDCAAFADPSGDYEIFNLPAATYTVKAYVSDYNFNAVNVTVAGSQAQASLLNVADTNTATLNGKINIVNPELGDDTSVFLVLESTFHQINSQVVNNVPVLTQGTMPPGLRVDKVDGDFSISGIPAGKYVILAAYEDDFLVRDPDTCISGTEIIHQEFNAGQTATLDNPFKVTGSISNLEPDNSELVSEVMPIFKWDEDASAKSYIVTVFDNFGNILMDEQTPDTNPEITYNGDALESGMYYQFRVVSLREKGQDICEISQSENLKGVFQKQ